jgi:hypothetical protein
MPGSIYSARTTITLPEDTLVFLQELALTEGSTVSALVRRAIFLAYPKGTSKTGGKQCQKKQNRKK